MNMILAGYDGSPSAQDAVRLASTLAGALGASLVVAFIFRDDGLQDSAWAGSLREMADRELAPARDLAPEAELVAFGASGTARGLQELAADRDADLVVVGSTHHGRLGRVVPGSTAQRLLGGAPCPVAVATRGWERPEGWPERVVVGFDGNPESELALDVAGRVAAAMGAAVQPVTVAELEPEGFPVLPGVAQSPQFELEARERRNAARREVRARQLDAAAERVAPGVPVEPELAEGDPAQAILERATESCLCVVGSRGYGPLGAVLLGSVAAEVIRDAPCPVIVTPRSAVEPPVTPPGPA